jgi:tetratricopeptide (TPR) repeat protein
VPARSSLTRPRLPKDLAVYLLLTAITIVVFGQVVRFDFVSWDDPWYVTENLHVRGGLTWDGIVWAFTSEHGGNWHPVTGLSHMLDCSLYGLDPTGPHVTNLVLHIVNTLLVFGVLRRMQCAVWPSAFVAALFAVHPLHVESVAWISQRKDVLSALFGLLSIRAYVAYASRGGSRCYVLTALFLTLGLLAKPMLVTLPLVFLLLDYWPLDRIRIGPADGSGHPATATRERVDPKRFRCPPRPVRDVLIEKVPLVVLALVSGVMTVIVQGRAGNMQFTESVSIQLRIANALVSYVRYIGKLIWPSNLSILYPHPNLPGGVPWTAWEVAGAALLLLAVTAAVVSSRGRRYPLVGWLWFLGMLVPVIGLLQVGRQAMADRYTYLPSIGLFIIVAWSAAEVVARWPGRQGRTRLVMALAAGGIVIAYMAAARSQVRYWRASLPLFERALVVTPRSPVLHNALGSALSARGRQDEAMGHYRQALAVEPENELAHYNLGIASQSRGHIDEAIRHYRRALAAKPDYAVAHNNLASVLVNLGRVEEAIAHYDQAVRFEPEYAVAHNNLANVLRSVGRVEEAIVHYRLAVKARPDYIAARHNLASALQSQGRVDEAIEQDRGALQVQPDFVPAHESLGMALQSQGREGEAREHFQEAQRLRSR